MKRSGHIVMLFGGILLSSLVALITYKSILMAVALIAVCMIVLYGAVLISKPLTGLYILVGYCFVYGFLGREVGGGIPFGLGIESFAVLTLLAVLVQYKNVDWAVLNNDVFKFFSLWLLLSILQLLNPYAGSVQGWIHEVRGVALYPILVVSLAFLLFKDPKSLHVFLVLVLLLSLLSALNGIKQKHIGLFPGEQIFLDDSPTHQPFGILRVFSFYVDAGQFGASQASFMLTALVLAFGPFSVWKRVALFALAGIFCYAMLISGTRGAFFALVSGGFFAILLSRNFKILTVGLIAMAMLFVFLKYTTIGNNNYDILRLRTALDPEDASLNLRFINQRILAEYMQHRPFGEGLGVIGFWGHMYNADKFLSGIEPDSYWVKVWAMFGIVGFTLWFCALMYLLGKGCGIIWNLQDKVLKSKIIALFSAGIGIFVCSYGNEVMNNMPSLLVFCVSLVFVHICPLWDSKTNPVPVGPEK